mmetsp:Transcript_70951/g.125444  ORF Transcript_70951/g.125444 Transcript_70951/m.125444 type:complete len:127 (-) Transcript_70951:198-578(-)
MASGPRRTLTFAVLGVCSCISLFLSSTRLDQGNGFVGLPSGTTGFAHIAQAETDRVREQAGDSMVEDPVDRPTVWDSEGRERPMTDEEMESALLAEEITGKVFIFFVVLIVPISVALCCPKALPKF